MVEVTISYREKEYKITKNSNYEAFKKSIEKKFCISFDNHRLEYKKDNDWIEICSDNDLKAVSEETKLRLVPKNNSK